MEDYMYGIVGALVGAGVATGISYAVWGRPAPVAPGGLVTFSKGLTGRATRGNLAPMQDCSQLASVNGVGWAATPQGGCAPDYSAKVGQVVTPGGVTQTVDGIPIFNIDGGLPTGTKALSLLYTKGNLCIILLKNERGQTYKVAVDCNAARRLGL